MFFGSVLCTEQLYCASRVAFVMFLRIFIFDRNRPFCKDHSLCIVANFSEFRKVVIFRILSVFLDPFFAQNN